MLTCLRCGNEWEPRKPNPKRCPACQNPTWNTPYKRKRNVPRGTLSTNIDMPAESVIIAPMSEHIDPDGAMMQAAPVDRLAEAKRKAMELYRKVAQ